jgi:hypothetical protein
MGPPPEPAIRALRLSTRRCASFAMSRSSRLRTSHLEREQSVLALVRLPARNGVELIAIAGLNERRSLELAASCYRAGPRPQPAPHRCCHGGHADAKSRLARTGLTDVCSQSWQGTALRTDAPVTVARNTRPGRTAVARRGLAAAAKTLDPVDVVPQMLVADVVDPNGDRVRVAGQFLWLVVGGESL